MYKKSKGITLIALVITIIVLLILAGVTINTLFGNENVLEKAQEAREKTDTSNKLEAVKLAVLNSILEGNGNNIDIEELRKNLESQGFTLQGESFPVIVEANGTKYIVDESGNVEEENIPEGVTIPEGFVASQATGENKVETGLVIYEGTDPVTNENVETARKTRNQFVWVPVDGKKLKYEQDHTYDSKYQYYYSNEQNDVNGETIWKWKDDDANKTSVEKYGGFYIGRYEAGWPDINQELVENSSSEIKYENKNKTDKLPVMKKGYAPWDFISQINAKAVSENLYQNLYNNKEVTGVKVRSQLIDSYAWDTTVNWLKNSGLVTETEEGKIDSTSYGNYFNATFPVTNVLYLSQKYYDTLTPAGRAANQTNPRWLLSTVYKVGSFSDVSANKQETSDYEYYTNEYIKVSLALGATDETKTNNIYDLAGNLWEWTTEVGDNSTNESITGTFAVRRGGSFGHYGYDYPVVYRIGNLSTNNYAFNIGFRVVLYLE